MHLPPAFYGKGGECTGGLPQFHHYGLQPRTAVHFPAHADGFVRYQEIFYPNRYQHPHRHAEGRDASPPKVPQFLPAGILHMVMVHGVVAHRNGARV